MAPPVTETINAAANKLTAVAQVSNGAVSNGTVPKTIPVQKLPTGQYTLVSVDIDTTGRRLIDEIVQLAAYTPKEHFEQYIMPYMNLNPAARQRHQVRVISIGFYRMLKSMQTSKIIKSKSEICALKDFLAWLEALKEKDPKSLGLILIYHEERKFIPYMILQALKKYNLLDRFLETVAAFANSRLLAQTFFSKEPAVRQPYTLRRLARFINNKFAENQDNNKEAAEEPPQTIARVSDGGNNNTFDGSASVRARLTYEVAHFLCNMEQRHSLDSDVGLQHLLTALHEQAQPIEADLQELKIQNENVERQNSFRPVFFPYFRATLFHRVRAVKFRIVLAEHGYDLNNLSSIWQVKGRDGLLSSLQSVHVLKPEERHELADLFDSYFDPKKTVVGPIIKNNRRRNRRGSATPRNGLPTERNAARTEPGASGDKQSSNGAVGQLPDSTTKSPMRSNSSAGYNKSNRGKRFTPRVRNGFRSQRFSQPQQQNANTQAAATAVTAIHSGTGNKSANAPPMPQPQRIAVAN